MSFCTKCGAQVDESAKFCPSCGATNASSTTSESAAPGTNAAPPATSGSPSVDTPLGSIDFSFDSKTTGTADPRDVADNKAMAILSYIIFFIPLIAGTHKTSPFVRFHVNQGTALFIAALIYSIALAIVESIIRFITPWSLWLPIGSVFNLIRLVPLVLMIIGIINAANGTLKQLPVIGGLKIIK